jgi:hypothetical protein
LVSKPVGLEFEPRPRIPLRVIPAYRSPYGGARIAQTSGPYMSERWGPGWYAVGGMLEPDKRPPHPFYITWILLGVMDDWID